MNVPTPPMTLVGRNKDGDRIGITAKIAYEYARSQPTLDGTARH